MERNDDTYGYVIGFDCWSLITIHRKFVLSNPATGDGRFKIFKIFISAYDPYRNGNPNSGTIIGTYEEAKRLRQEILDNYQKIAVINDNVFASIEDTDKFDPINLKIYELRLHEIEEESQE